MNRRTTPRWRGREDFAGIGQSIESGNLFPHFGYCFIVADWPPAFWSRSRQDQSPGHDVSAGARREVTLLRGLKNRTDQSKVEAVAEPGLEQARAVEVEGTDEDGAVGQDAVAEGAGEIDGESRALASCAADGGVKGRVQANIGPVVRALDAPAWPLALSGSRQKSRFSLIRRARRIWN